MRMWQTRLLDTLGFLGTYSRVWRESRVVATASVKKNLRLLFLSFLVSVVHL